MGEVNRESLGSARWSTLSTNTDSGESAYQIFYNLFLTGSALNKKSGKKQVVKPYNIHTHYVHFKSFITDCQILTLLTEVSTSDNG